MVIEGYEFGRKKNWRLTWNNSNFSEESFDIKNYFAVKKLLQDLYTTIFVLIGYGCRVLNTCAV